MSGSNIIEGDVTSFESLLAASHNVDAVIDVHGVSIPRFSKFPSDLFSDPRNEPSHPYSVNFVGVRNVLEAIKQNKIKKYVRITGSLVDASAFNPFVVLFNLLLSFTNKWHGESEKLIRQSGVDYTVIRPTGIVEVPRAKDANVTTQLVLAPPENKFKISNKSKISASDIADLCVDALSDIRLRNTTLLIKSEIGNGPNDWSTLISLNNIKPDKKPLKSFNPYKLAVALYCFGFLSTAIGILNLLSKLVLLLLNAIIKGIPAFLIK